ncbi:MAG TPA: hypothetical protein VFA09_03865 [Ktedonobacteraceae bacterium]|nr:hypothetical protein [Ktedonobacteraceae bacterium]
MHAQLDLLPSPDLSASARRDPAAWPVVLSDRGTGAAKQRRWQHTVGYGRADRESRADCRMYQT